MPAERDGARAGSPFLFTEPPAVSRRIAALGVARAVGRGELVYRQGVASRHFHQVVTGRVRIFMSRPDGHERVIAYGEAGASVGEAGCFDGLPRYASCVAVVDSEVLWISRDAVIGAARADPAIMLEVARRIAHKQRVLSMQVAADGLSAAGRVVVLLAHLAEAYGQERGGASVRLRVRLAVDELAQLVGMTRVTMSRELSRLVAEGLVAKEGRGIVLRDVDEVRRRAAALLA